MLKKIEAGQIDGVVYDGACACLVGTLANYRDQCYRGFCDDIGHEPLPSHPAEAWFSNIFPGDKPESNFFADKAAEWCHVALKT